MQLRLATRGSALAWGQSSQIAEALRALGHEVELVRITTHGDVSTAPLTSMGGAGVFVGAVRAAVLDGSADFAVHSFKDLPTAAEPGLALAAVPQREDPVDALCTSDGRTLAELPTGSKVGTGSPRRAAQLRALRPDLEVVEIRGNVETRLARAGTDLDAVILAAAGLRRIGLGHRISERFDPQSFLPAPSQGALALECRSDDSAVRAALAELDDPVSRWAAVAERGVLAGLQAGCAAPVAAYAMVNDDAGKGSTGTLHAVVVAEDGSTRLAAHASAPADDSGASAVADLVVRELLSQGAADLVDLGATKAKPLDGKHLLLPSRTPAGLARALDAAGARVTEVEFTRQEALPFAPLETALSQAWDWVVISSPATVRVLTEAGWDLRARFGSGHVAAIGPATAGALSRAGVAVAMVAYPGGGAALVEEFTTGTGRVLLPGAEESSVQPASGLAAKGWQVLPVPVYRTVPQAIPSSVVDTWQQGGFDAFVVTAGSIAAAAVAACGVPGPVVVAIGEPSAVASRTAGLEVVQVALRPVTDSLLAAVFDALTATAPNA